MSPLLLLAAIILVPLLALAAIEWRRALVLALPFLVVLNGVAIPAGNSSVRLDQIAALLLVVPLVAPILTGARRLRTDTIVWLLAAILGLNVVASVLRSPTVSYSLQQCANLASVWIIYLLLLNFLDTREEIDAFFHRVLWAGVLGCVVAIAAFLLAVAGLPLGGAQVSLSAAERFTDAYGAYGTLLEPNILGSFAAAHLVLATGLLIIAARSPATVPHVRLLRWLASAAAVALVLSFTRAAWLGAAAGALWFVVSGRHILGLRIRIGRVLTPLALGCAVALILLVLPGPAGTLFRFKISNLVNLTSQTAALRFLTYSMAAQQATEHLVLGWGTYSFAPLVAQGSDFQQFENWRGLWIGNFLLLALHDTGLIGLTLWLGLLWTSLARPLRAARAMLASDPRFAGQAVALVAAVFSLVLPFLATSGFSLGYSWLLIGLLGAHARLAPSPASATAPAPAPLAELGLSSLSTDAT